MGLTLNDRKEIAKRWAEGESAASIATRLGFATVDATDESGIYGITLEANRSR